MVRFLLLGSLLAGSVLAQDCVLTVPANPLTAAGLATPYTITGCSQRSDSASFIECAIYDNAGTIELYAPLVVDAGDKVNVDFVKPVVPTIPQGATVACWFGSNGDSVTLTGPGATQCVNGLGSSAFGQFAHCNGDKFMTKALADAKSGKLVVPPLGNIATGDTTTGTQCPSTRDFRIVDQDQSDNVVSTFLIHNGHVLSQNTPAEAAKGDSTKVTNGSDNGLVDNILDPILGCTPWKGKTITNPAGVTGGLALNELQAAIYQKNPAIVPLTDPMVLVGTATSLQKTNLYRAAVGQPLAATAADADGLAYCKGLALSGIFIENNKALFSSKPSPNTGAANNLYTFLASRFEGSLDMLNCLTGLKIAQPVTSTVDGTGVVTSASINLTDLSKITGIKVTSNSSSSASASKSSSSASASKVASSSASAKVSVSSASGSVKTSPSAKVSPSAKASVSSVSRSVNASLSAKASSSAKLSLSSVPVKVASSASVAASSVVSPVAGSASIKPSKSAKSASSSASVMVSPVAGSASAKISSSSVSKSASPSAKPSLSSAPVKVASSSKVAPSVSASASAGSVSTKVSVASSKPTPSSSSSHSRKHHRTQRHSRASTLSKVVKPSASLPVAIPSKIAAVASSTAAAIASSIAASGVGGMQPSKCASGASPFQTLANGLVKDSATGQLYFPIPPGFAGFF